MYVYLDTGVMPLIYHALESEHANVQEKVLGAIPLLCDNLDYSTLQDILLVKVAVRLVCVLPINYSEAHFYRSPADRLYQNYAPLRKGRNSSLFPGHGHHSR
jgi:hypothetical protein